MRLSKPNYEQLEKSGLAYQHIALATLQKEFDCSNEFMAEIMGFKSARNYLRYYNGLIQALRTQLKERQTL